MQYTATLWGGGIKTELNENLEYTTKMAIKTGISFQTEFKPAHH